LNNLKDITLSKKFSNICGYTHDDLEEYFKDYLKRFVENEDICYNDLLDKINYWYDGYSWDGESSLYNPYSTLLLLDEEEFSNYWFETGTPTFLIDSLKIKNGLKPIVEPIIANKNDLNTFDIGNINSTTLMFQSGYLTIKEKKRVYDVLEYVLDIPNFEIKDSLINYLMLAFTNSTTDYLSKLRKEIYHSILKQKPEKLSKSLKEIFNQIPYTLKGNKENFYHSILIVILYLFGIEVQGEVMTFKGRIDLVLKINQQTIITEIKYSHKKTIETMLKEGFKQIKNREYYNKYIKDQAIYLSIAFTKEEIACQFKEKL
jgi:hypothetical protein